MSIPTEQWLATRNVASLVRSNRSHVAVAATVISRLNGPGKAPATPTEDLR
jgi:hypothetical protein